MPRSIRNHLALAPLALAVLAVLAATPARADSSSFTLNSFNPGQVEVKSNGSSYTTTAIPLVSLSASVTVQADAGFSGHVKSWSAWIGAQLDVGPTVQFSNHKVSRSYGLGNRPKSVNEPANINVPFGTFGTYAVAQCNALAAKLRSQGLPDEAIFGQDRNLKPGIVAIGTVEFNGVGAPALSEVIASPPQLDIVCKAHKAPPKPGTTAGQGVTGVGPALLTQVTMVVQHPPSPTPVQCPVEATAFMTFRAQGTGPDGQPLPPGHFSYKVRTLSGKVSKTDIVVLQESDRSGPHFSKTITHKFMVGAPGMAPTVSAPGVGPVGQQAAGGLMAGGGGAGGPGPAAGAAGSYASGAAPVDPNVHKDSLWIDVEGAKAGSVMKSDYFPYSVTCQVAKAIGGGPGSVQAKPNPQRPGSPLGESAGPQTGTPAGGMPRQPPGKPAGVAASAATRKAAP